MRLYWSQYRALLFMNSLQLDYTHFYDKYNYLEFLFEMAKAWYNFSASSQQTFKYLISSPHPLLVTKVFFGVCRQVLHANFFSWSHLL